MPQIQLKPVSSSQIEAVGCDLTRGRIYIEFKVKNGRSVYEYEAFDAKLMAELVFAASVGRTFRDTLKADPARYPYRKLTSGEVAELVTTNAPDWLAALESVR